ncbi:MinD/ParA family ATP-binding protein [Pseudactinotalea sp. Z1748]|uniref:MinD/ParA family ATP-binding protein n=1 Tax=Pseudactinotalea sp. Z1748 TaxID=3413027 RepID=UPI003C7A3A50
MGIGEHSVLPEVLAQVRSERTAVVAFNGGTYELSGRDLADTRAEALHYITGLAAQIVGGPVQVALTDPDGTGWRLVVTPDGEVIDEAPAAGGTMNTVAEDHSPAPTAGSAEEASPATATAVGSGTLDPETADPAILAAPTAADPAARPDLGLGVEPGPEAFAPPAAPERRSVRPAFSPGSVSHAFRDQPGAPAAPAAPEQVGGLRDVLGSTARAQETEVLPEIPGAPGPAAPGPAGGAYAPPGHDGHSHAALPGTVPPPDHYGPGESPVRHTGSAQSGDDAQSSPRRRELRESFLRTEQAEAPATQGVRGALTKVGIRTSPSATERAERADVNAVSQHWPGVRTIAVVNGKGGANKTPTTALLAAVFARNSGAATLAWDNNETRGTLGWRTEQGKHEATVQELLPRGHALLDPAAKAGDISHFVHHQAADKYDVLRSNPNVLSAEQRITGEDVDLVHDVAGRYYRLIFIDSGNDESADHWLRMIDKADQLVVATIAKPEHAEAGALLLEALGQRDEHSARLAHGAVVVVSQAREKDVNPSVQQIADGFAGWVREVVTIPYDRAMVESVLRFESLAAETQRAWLRAGAAVAGGL